MPKRRQFLLAHFTPPRCQYIPSRFQKFFQKFSKIILFVICSTPIFPQAGECNAWVTTNTRRGLWWTYSIEIDRFGWFRPAAAVGIFHGS